MNYEIEVKIPESISKNYTFIFLGIESKDGKLIYREDLFEKEKEYKINFFSDIPPSHLVLWSHNGKDWNDDKFVKPIPDNSVVYKENKFNKEEGSVEIEEFNKRVQITIIDDIEERETLIHNLAKKLLAEGFKNIKVLNSSVKGVPVIKNLEDYSKFCLRNLYKFCEKEYMLICQWDGFILNKNNFLKEFFNYDYIGSTWLHHPNTVSGNGGFSLRSKKFLQECATIFNYREDCSPEDGKIEELSSELIKRGIKFAPKEIRDKFSVENGVYTNQFGFHNYLTQNLPDWVRGYFKNKFYHSGDLGDVIYSLPTIKKLGGGCLVLSPDYKGMEVRCAMTYEKAMHIRELLSETDFITQVNYHHLKPVDIDYDLNSVRQGFIDWGAGKLNEQQINELREKKLVKMYEDEFSVSDTDIKPYLQINQKIVNEKYPIVINRTDRYQNPSFPWLDILRDFRDKIMFVGSEKEHQEFSNSFKKIKFIPTPTYMILAQVIKGSKLFIGNQSFPYSIAESLKHNCIQETALNVPNCKYERHNSYLTPDSASCSYNNIKKFILQYI